MGRVLLSSPLIFSSMRRLNSLSLTGKFDGWGNPLDPRHYIFLASYPVFSFNLSADRQLDSITTESKALREVRKDTLGLLSQPSLKE